MVGRVFERLNCIGLRTLRSKIKFVRFGFVANSLALYFSGTAKICSTLRQIGFVAAVLGLCFPCIAVAGVFPQINGQPSVGWNGYYLVGRWTPVRVPINIDDVANSETLPIQLELTAVDPDGNRVRYISPIKELARGAHQVEGLIKVGCLDGEIGIRINQNGDEKRYRPGKGESLQLPLKPSTRLIVTVGSPYGFDFETETAKSGMPLKIAAVKAETLPENRLAYDGVSSLVLAGSAKLTPSQSHAIREWVSAGGRLIISLPQDVDSARGSLPEWVPVKIAMEPAIVREFGGLEAFSGKNNRIPQRSTLAIPHLEIEAGEILAPSRSIPFLVRVPYGMGSVTVLAMDLTASPLRDWKEVSAFCSRLTAAGTNADLADKSGMKGTQLSSTGITDLATQLHAIQEDFDRVHRVSPWFVMAWLLALLVVIGPIDYLIVHRILKRPYLTWVTFPLVAAVSALLASSLSATTNGTSRRANQLNLINVDVASGSVHGRHFVNVYCPSTSQLSVKLESLPLISHPQLKPTSRLIWEGVPESSFGGMLRETGLQRGATYEQQPEGELTQVPVMQWSSKGLVGDSVSSAEGLIECDLRASAAGSLTGTIVHRFAAPIEDWMIVYQNRVYRQLKTRDDSKSSPLPPKQVWRVDQPGIFQRELRPYLTGILTMATPKFGSRSSSDASHHQSAYDPLSLDPFDLVRILTFHDDIGGERYTGLTNQLMDDQDCSHLLKLGRAILFGRLNQPLVTFRLDDETLQPNRESSFVRLIFPVARSAELMKELKRVVPD